MPRMSHRHAYRARQPPPALLRLMHVKQKGKLRQKVCWPVVNVPPLKFVVKHLLLVLFMTALFALYQHTWRVQRVLDRMVIAWTMLLQVMQRSGLVGEIDTPPDLARFLLAARNLTI